MSDTSNSDKHHNKKQKLSSDTSSSDTSSSDTSSSDTSSSSSDKQKRGSLNRLTGVRGSSAYFIGTDQVEKLVKGLASGDIVNSSQDNSGIPANTCFISSHATMETKMVDGKLHFITFTPKSPIIITAVMPFLSSLNINISVFGCLLKYIIKNFDKPMFLTSDNFEEMKLWYLKECLKNEKIKKKMKKANASRSISGFDITQIQNFHLFQTLSSSPTIPELILYCNNYEDSIPCGLSIISENGFSINFTNMFNDDKRGALLNSILENILGREHSIPFNETISLTREDRQIVVNYNSHSNLFACPFLALFSYFIETPSEYIDEELKDIRSLEDLKNYLIEELEVMTEEDLLSLNITNFKGDDPFYSSKIRGNTNKLIKELKLSTICAYFYHSKELSQYPLSFLNSTCHTISLDKNGDDTRTLNMIIAEKMYDKTHQELESVDITKKMLQSYFSQVQTEDEMYEILSKFPTQLKNNPQLQKLFVKNYKKIRGEIVEKKISKDLLSKLVRNHSLSKSGVDLKTLTKFKKKRRFTDRKGGSKYKRKTQKKRKKKTNKKRKLRKFSYIYNYK